MICPACRQDTAGQHEWNCPNAPEPQPIRGTFAPIYKRNILFTIEVDISPEKLPQWNPAVLLP